MLLFIGWEMKEIEVDDFKFGTDVMLNFRGAILCHVLLIVYDRIELELT